MGGQSTRAAPGRPPPAMLLDAFGTLVAMEPPGPLLREELARRAGIEVSEEAAEAAFGAEISFYLQHHLEGRDRRSLDDLRDRCATVLADSLGLRGGAHRDAVGPAMLASLRFSAYADAPGALRSLRARGARLVVASNWDCSLPAVLAEAGLAELVDGVVSSAVAGAAKPAAAVFEAALDRAGVPAEAAVHVGDSPVGDVEGARAAGIEAILLDRAGGANAPGVRTIDSLSALPSLLFPDR